MRILSLIPVKEMTQSVLDTVAAGVEIVPVTTYLENSEMYQDIEIVIGNHDILTNLDALPKNLKWIQIGSAGYNHLPLEAYQERGIRLTNGSGLHAKGMAESVFGMIFAETRWIRQSILNQLDKKWQGNFHLAQLENKTMLIVGAGHVGEQVAKIAKAFEMTVVGVRSTYELKENFDAMETLDTWSETLGKADFIVNILPGQVSDGLYNLDTFAKFNPDAIFINVGRGTAVVSEDLITALNENLLALALLDVTNPEPLPVDSPLWGHEKVRIYPHVSGATEDYYRKLWTLFSEQLKAHLNGEKLANIVIKGQED